MAISWERRRLRLLRAYEDRFTDDMRGLARQIGELLQRFAVGATASTRLIPNTRAVRQRISAAIWTQVIKPYFIGAGDQALDRHLPKSPYARLMVQGIESAIRLQAERQVAIVEKYAGRDPVVLRWLTQNPPAIREMDGRGAYDPFHLFVYKDRPYVLSDRAWQTALEVRARIDRLLDYEISLGTAAVDIAELLEQYLTYPAARLRTTKPYGVSGSYAARRLARTEITAAGGRSMVNMSIANPFVDLIQWVRSSAHREPDICDANANGGPNGDGTYPPNELPQYPAHPHEMCFLVPRVVKNPAQVVEDLRAEIDRDTPAAQELRGVFNLEWLVRALMTGFFAEWLFSEETR